LSFKVGGIIELIGPAEGTDWDEGTPVRAGAVLAELKQADFVASMWQPPAPGNANPVPSRKTPARMIAGVNPPRKAQQASKPALHASHALEMRSS
jgi:hypothetical protein